MSDALLSADAFRLLGDPARLRILALLARERLNVSELTEVLGLAQSGVSRHVRLLREGGLVRETREGGWKWLALEDAPPPGLGDTWPALRRAVAEGQDTYGDAARLADVLRAREERRVGWGDARRPAEPGRSWAAWARALGHLLPPLDVADLGCGTGALTVEVARWAGSVRAVDSDASVLDEARRRFEGEGLHHVTCIDASLDALPLDDASVDLALLSQVLHDLDDPQAAIHEAARITRQGGRVLVLDLLPHAEAWTRERLGHRRQGFEPAEVEAWLREAGLDVHRAEEAARRRGNPFTVLVASARRSEGKR